MITAFFFTRVSRPQACSHVSSENTLLTCDVSVTLIEGIDQTTVSIIETEKPINVRHVLRQKFSCRRFHS